MVRRVTSLHELNPLQVGTSLQTKAACQASMLTLLETKAMGARAHQRFDDLLRFGLLQSMRTLCGSWSSICGASRTGSRRCRISRPS